MYVPGTGLIGETTVCLLFFCDSLSLLFHLRHHLPSPSSFHLFVGGDTVFFLKLLQSLFVAFFAQVYLEFSELLIHLWKHHIHTRPPTECLPFERDDPALWHNSRYMRQTMDCLKSGLVRFCMDFDDEEKTNSPGLQLSERFFCGGIPVPFNYNANPRLLQGIQQVLLKFVIFFCCVLMFCCCCCRCSDMRGEASLIIAKNRKIATAAQTIEGIYFLQGQIGKSNENWRWPRIYAGFPILLALETSMRGFGELMGFETRHFQMDGLDLVVCVPIRKNRRKPKKDERGRTWFTCLADGFGSAKYFQMLYNMMGRADGRIYTTKSFFVSLQVCLFFFFVR